MIRTAKPTYEAYLIVVHSYGLNEVSILVDIYSGKLTARLILQGLKLILLPLLEQMNKWCEDTRFHNKWEHQHHTVH